MKTKIIFTTHYIGEDSYIFDKNNAVDKASFSALSAYGVTNCHIIKGEDTEVIALNKRTEGASCLPLSRIRAIIEHFCNEEVTQLYLFLHSNTDLPLCRFQRQPIGEYKGWKNDLSLPNKNSTQSAIRIWAMTHEKNLDRGAYILHKSAYRHEPNGICADAVLKRVQSIFLVEDIRLLWDQYVVKQTSDIFDQLLDRIKELQRFSFIQSFVNVTDFINMGLTDQYEIVEHFLGHGPSIFR